MVPQAKRYLFHCHLDVCNMGHLCIWVVVHTFPQEITESEKLDPLLVNRHTHSALVT